MVEREYVGDESMILGTGPACALSEFKGVCYARFETLQQKAKGGVWQGLRPALEQKVKIPSEDCAGWCRAAWVGDQCWAVLCERKDDTGYGTGGRREEKH